MYTFEKIAGNPAKLVRDFAPGNIGFTFYHEGYEDIERVTRNARMTEEFQIKRMTELAGRIRSARIILVDKHLIMDNADVFLAEKPPEDQAIGLPFESVWIECLQLKQLLYRSVHATVSSYTFGLLVQEIDRGFRVTTVSESEPNDNDKGGRMGIVITHEVINGQAPPQSHGEHALKLLSFMFNRKNLSGETKFNGVFKAREGLEPSRVRKVVVIKGARSDVESLPSGQKIEWKHAWEVMGHWRKCDGVGKNRHDEYVVPQRTWVKPHVKGDGPLIVKTRIIQGDTHVS